MGAVGELSSANLDVYTADASGGCGLLNALDRVARGDFIAQIGTVVMGR